MKVWFNGSTYFTCVRDCSLRNNVIYTNVSQPGSASCAEWVRMLCWRGPQVVLKGSASYAEGARKLCWRGPEVKLKGSASYAEGVRKLCWRGPQIVLKDSASYAAGVRKLCWRGQRVDYILLFYFSTLHSSMFMLFNHVSISKLE
jgi:hypothetical protein